MKLVRKGKFLPLLLSLIILLSVPFTFYASAKETSKPFQMETDASISFTGGPLRLETVPNLHFGSHRLQYEEANHSPILVEDTVLLTDARGTFSGWSLKTNLSTFQGEEKAGLPGASIIFQPTNNPKAVNSAGVVPTGRQDYIELVSGDEISHTVWSAHPGEGTGTWSIELNPAEVELFIPRGAADVGDYHAIMEWTLVDGPTF